jgi:hypothetical protein
LSSGVPAYSSTRPKLKGQSEAYSMKSRFLRTLGRSVSGSNISMLKQTNSPSDRVTSMARWFWLERAQRRRVISPWSASVSIPT